VFILSTVSLGGRSSYRQLVLWKDNVLSMDVWGFNTHRLTVSVFVGRDTSAEGLMMRALQHCLFCNCTLDFEENHTKSQSR
jgi:hypothetical protein